MAQIFISHKSDDLEIALDVKQKIESELDIACWIDDEDLRAGSEAWIEKIQSAIHDSFALIVVVTPDSLASVWVSYEWIFALGANIEVISVTFDNLSDKDWEITKLAERLKLFQYRKLPEQCDKLFTDLRAAQMKKQGKIIAPLGASPFITNMAEKLNSEGVNGCAEVIGDLEASQAPNVDYLLKETAREHHIRHLAVIAHAKRVGPDDIEYTIRSPFGYPLNAYGFQIWGDLTFPVPVPSRLMYHVRKGKIIGGCYEKM